MTAQTPGLVWGSNISDEAGHENVPTFLSAERGGFWGEGQGLGVSRGRARIGWRRGRSRLPVLSAIMLALLHGLFQCLLMIRKQGMNLAMSLVADSVNLRSKLR